MLSQDLRVTRAGEAPKNVLTGDFIAWLGRLRRTWGKQQSELTLGPRNVSMLWLTALVFWVREPAGPRAAGALECL